MDDSDIVNLVKNHCALLAKQYNQDKDELFSYVLAKIPGMAGRIDKKGYTTLQCKSYIKKSVRGYCLHYMRDEANIIRTPRSCVPYGSQTLLDTDYVPDYASTSDIPWYIEHIMGDPNLCKRISNAYIRYLDT